MKHNTPIRDTRAAVLGAYVTVTIGAVWLICEIAAYLPLEITISLLAIAGLLGLAFLDFQQTTPGMRNARKLVGPFHRRLSRISQTLRGVLRATA